MRNVITSTMGTCHKRSMVVAICILMLFLSVLALVGCGGDSSSSTGPDDSPGGESSSSIERISSSSRGKVTDKIGVLAEFDEPAERTSSSSKKAKSSSSVTQSDAKQSSSSEKTGTSSSSVKKVSSSSLKSGDSSSSSKMPKKYAEAKVMPLGTYDCSEYSCFSTEYLNQEFLEVGRYGEILDERDGQVYKVIEIVDQVWMAQNLNYETTNSYCYNDDTNCTKYGRLYTWAAAIDSVALYNGGKGMDCGYGKACILPDTVYGICPPGWHLPTNTEWNTLVTEVGGDSTAGKILKSKTGWYNNGNGTDGGGFSALPAGLRNYDGYFIDNGYGAYFWSATANDGNYASFMNLYHSLDSASQLNRYKYNAFSVRCIKD